MGVWPECARREEGELDASVDAMQTHGAAQSAIGGGSAQGREWWQESRPHQCVGGWVCVGGGWEMGVGVSEGPAAPS
jgi:hypothetical protein